MSVTPTQIFYAIYSFNLIVFIWEFYLSYRQYRVHYNNKKRPDHVAEIISEEDYDKARLYELDNHRFGFFHDIFEQIRISIILWTNFAAYLWGVSGKITSDYYGENEIIQSLVFCFIYSALDLVFSLPFDYYDNFVIEEKFGFNKQTRSFFFVDHLKKFVVDSALNAPLIFVIVWIIKNSGHYFFIYAWLFASLFEFAIMHVYPEFIAPLFDKYSALPESELKEKIEALATRVNFPLTKLYVVEGSKRSSHSNAYMYGFWKNKRIVLYDTLLSPEMNEQLKKGNNQPIEEKKSEEEFSDEEEGSEEEQESLGMSDDEVVGVLAH
jgi:STE24 endopeptidase